ncbi:MAG: hypothetical protein LBF84_00510 [Holosporales bacterium]|nr:hypothetical protein [Holosporales bacterium]
MNILKIGLIAALLLQSNAGYADVLNEGVKLPSPVLKQLCDEIIENGNIALEYIGSNALPPLNNTVWLDSNNWYIMKNINRALEGVRLLSEKLVKGLHQFLKQPTVMHVVQQ